MQPEYIRKIRSCDICSEHLPLGPNPVFQVSHEATVMVIGQAPGKKVHETGIPWDDPSGRNLRKWMGVTDEEFYGRKIALMPMGFCYPGKGKSGDLPPRPECAPKWHHLLLAKMPNIQLTILIGQYAQSHYLGEKMKSNLTATVQAYKEYTPHFIPLPHPSPRNRFWLSKNLWFEREVVPYLQKAIKEGFKKSSHNLEMEKVRLQRPL